MSDNSQASGPILIETSSKVVAINPATGEVMEVTDSSKLSQIQGLIKRREELGVELSRQLKSSGLVTANDDEPTAVTLI